ncbi:MAG: alpha/beta hydrolase [Fuerstiella sp.]
MTDSETKRTDRAGSVIRRLLRGFLIAYTLVVILFGFLQRHLLYHPQKASNLSVAGFHDVTTLFPAATDVQLTCRSGTIIRGWLLRKSDVPEATATRPLVIYFHGNAGNRAGRKAWYATFHNAGADVLAMDYHGYGDSGGKMTEDALELTADAAWEFAVDKLGYRSSNIVIAGTSLGGAAAVYLASQQSETEDQPAALVTVATFSSMVDVAGSHYPWLPVGAILVDRYPSAQRIAKVSCPVIVMHGDNDTLVPQRFGRRLFDAAPNKSVSEVEKRWVNLPNVGHNDLLSVGRDHIHREVNRVVAAVNNRKTTKE